jgi:toluene monooxygenase electron transfer component
MTGVVASIEEVAPSVVDVTIATDEPCVFRPGQFAIVEGPHGQRRCYSLAGESGRAGIRLVVKRYDGRPVSSWMASLRAGDPVTFHAPYGDVWLRETARPLLLVAGGSGISAILGLVRHAAAEARHRRMTVLYGARTRADLALLDELHGLVAAHGDASLVAVVDSGDPGNDARLGLVTDLIDGLDCAASDVYLAGPPAMVDAVDLVLLARGMPRDHLYVDRFG